jgi:hypothetical protein
MNQIVTLYGPSKYEVKKLRRRVVLKSQPQQPSLTAPTRHKVTERGSPIMLTNSKSRSEFAKSRSHKIMNDHLIILFFQDFKSPATNNLFTYELHFSMSFAEIGEGNNALREKGKAIAIDDIIFTLFPFRGMLAKSTLGLWAFWVSVIAARVCEWIVGIEEEDPINGVVMEGNRARNVGVWL